MAQSGNPRIPEDLVWKIVSKILVDLPVKDLLKFRSVCKPWRCLIDDPRFVNQHHLRSSNRPGGIKFLMAQGGGRRQDLILVDLEGNTSRIPRPGPAVRHALRPGCPVISVEGLVCFGDVVWNPSTRKSIHLPPPPPLNVHKPLIINKFQLGFDALTKQHKVLRICGYNMDYDHLIPHRMGTAEFQIQIQIQIQIFTLGTTSWRDITQHIPDEGRTQITYMPQASLYLQNEIYFLIRYNHFSSLMVFSVRDETFRSVRLPNSIAVNCCLWALIELNGCVALMAGLDRMKEIWVLTDLDAARWEKITVPSWLRFLYALAFERENTVVCAINSTEVLVQSKWKAINSPVVQSKRKRRERVHCFIGDVKSKRIRLGPNLKKGMRVAEIHSKHVETLFDPAAAAAALAFLN